MKRSFLIWIFVCSAPVFGAERVIVEFREAPLARRTSVSASSYTDSFARFRRDLGTLVPRTNANGAKAVDAATITHEYYRAFHGVAVTVPAEAVAKLRLLPYVRAVTPETEVQAYADGASQRTSEADDEGDSIAIVGAKALWSTRGARGTGMVIAILDTGIDYRHPALGGGFGPGRKVAGGWDFVNNDPDPMDDQFHGTHVAGIAAAKSSEFSGVAPEATLIAFKVLNSSGRGANANIIAAIERTLDPNDDGNLSDRVDVANISLGGIGNPDDPMARAVDAATAAGVVFCIAAGNIGDFLTIGSPGVSRSAITVGSTWRATEMAATSSRGPNTRDLSVKPEVVAPGEDVLSTLPNDRLGILSGTSMSTPHVAGLAALLLELHPNWTPAQVKSALANSGKRIDAQIIEQGGGLVDGLRAASTTLFAEPSTISFGLGEISAESWTRRQTLRLTNLSAAAQSLTLAADDTPAGVTVAIEPASFALAAGASRDVAVSIAVNNAEATITRSQTIGGIVRIDGGENEVVLPWAAVKAARATVTYDLPFPSSAFMNDLGWVGLSAAVDAFTRETLLPAGRYDLSLAAISEPDPTTLVGQTMRLHIRDQVLLDGDVTVALSSAEPMHRLTFAARDERGELLTDVARRAAFDRGAYLAQLRVQRTGTTLFLPMPLRGGFEQVEITTVSDRWTFRPFETYVDLASNDLYNIAHAPFTGINAAKTLTRSAGDLTEVGVRFDSTPGDPVQQVHIVPHIVAAGSFVSSVQVSDTADNGVWAGRLFLTDPDEAWVSGMIFDVRSANGLLFVDPVHMRDGRVVSTFQRVPGPAVYAAAADETLSYGVGAFYPRMTTPILPDGRFNLVGNFLGQRGDNWRRRGLDDARVTLRDGNGAVLVNGRLIDVGWNLSVQQRRAYTLEVAASPSVVRDLPATGTLRYAFDTRREDAVPPSFTSFRIVDGNGRATESVAVDSSPTIDFSAADYTFDAAYNPVYQKVLAEGAKAWWRRSGETAWHEVTANVLFEHAPENAAADGVVYRANLDDATRAGSGFFDVRVEITDQAGNTSSWTLAPAFSVGLDQKRRAVR